MSVCLLRFLPPRATRQQKQRYHRVNRHTGKKDNYILRSKVIASEQAGPACSVYLGGTKVTTNGVLSTLGTTKQPRGQNLRELLAWSDSPRAIYYNIA